MSLSTTASSYLSAACSMHVVQQQRKLCRRFVDMSAVWRGCRTTRHAVQIVQVYRKEPASLNKTTEGWCALKSDLVSEWTDECTSGFIIVGSLRQVIKQPACLQWNVLNRISAWKETTADGLHQTHQQHTNKLNTHTNGKMNGHCSRQPMFASNPS